MSVRQFLHEERVGLSYLFGSGGYLAGAVVDAIGRVEPRLEAAANAGLFAPAV